MVPWRALAITIGILTSFLAQVFVVIDKTVEVLLLLSCGINDCTGCIFQVGKIDLFISTRNINKTGI